MPTVVLGPSDLKAARRTFAWRPPLLGYKSG